MKRLLDAVGESRWAKWIDDDITEWRTNRNTSHHLSAYGGMGSFNDVIICRVNRHRVAGAQEPWGNATFEWLKSLCHFLANNPEETYTGYALAEVFGRHDSVLAACIGAKNELAVMRGQANEERTLQGWRCLRCGHGETSPNDIERFIAQDVLPALVVESCERLTVDQLVDRMLVCDIPNLERMRESLAAAVMAGGIALTNRDGWMRPCPNCGDDDTAVYRWRLAINGDLRFVPSDDNLPMRE